MTHLNEVQRQLIIQLRSATLLSGFAENIVITTDTDFSSDGIQIDLAKLPIMFLTGPDVVPNNFFRTNEKPTERYGPMTSGPDPVPSQFRTFTAEDAVDLIYNAVIVHNHEREFMDLLTKVHAYFMNGKKVSAKKDPDDIASSLNSYEVDLVNKFRVGSLVNRSNLKNAAGKILVRGVLISDGDVFQEGHVAEEIILDSNNIVP